MKTKAIIGGALLAITLGIGSAAQAAVDVDGNGVGFVGKGDVQLASSLNNAQLQSATVAFRMTSITETTWECLNSNNQNVQMRERTTTTEGLVSSTARVKNQITGFNLHGFNGATTTTTEGPALNSCPNGPWGFVEGSTETVPVEGGALQVSANGSPWTTL